MRASPIVLAVMLAGVAALRAQIVNDGATNTLANVTTNITGTVTVGTNGSFTLLTLSDNAMLTNSVRGVIGQNATAQSNEVRLIRRTSLMRVGNFSFTNAITPGEPQRYFRLRTP